MSEIRRCYVKETCSCTDCASAKCLMRIAEIEDKKCSCEKCTAINTCLFYKNNAPVTCDKSTSCSGAPEPKDDAKTKEAFKHEIIYELANDCRSFSYESTNIKVIPCGRAPSVACKGNCRKPPFDSGAMNMAHVEKCPSVVEKKTPILTTSDIYNRIVEAYKACSCKVCECISKVYTNPSGECSCKPCECVDCLKISGRSTKHCMKYSCNNRVHKPMEKTKNPGMCSCLPCECVICSQLNDTKERLETCSCKPCQCADCKMHKRKKNAIFNPIVAQVMQVQNELVNCTCEPCTCPECTGHIITTPLARTQEISTGVNRHPECRCESCVNESCVNESCVPDGVDVCRCERQRVVMRKPVTRDSNDYDVRRASFSHANLDCIGSKCKRTYHNNSEPIPSVTSDFSKLQQRTYVLLNSIYSDMENSYFSSNQHDDVNSLYNEGGTQGSKDIQDIETIEFDNFSDQLVDIATSDTDFDVDVIPEKDDEAELYKLKLAKQIEYSDFEDISETKSCSVGTSEVNFSQIVEQTHQPSTFVLNVIEVTTGTTNFAEDAILPTENSEESGRFIFKNISEKSTFDWLNFKTPNYDSQKLVPSSECLESPKNSIGIVDIDLDGIDKNTNTNRLACFGTEISEFFNNEKNVKEEKNTNTAIAISDKGTRVDNSIFDLQVYNIRLDRICTETRSFSAELMKMLNKFEKANREFENISKKLEQTQSILLDMTNKKVNIPKDRLPQLINIHNKLSKLKENTPTLKDCTSRAEKHIQCSEGDEINYRVLDESTGTELNDHTPDDFIPVVNKSSLLQEFVRYSIETPTHDYYDETSFTREEKPVIIKENRNVNSDTCEEKVKVSYKDLETLLQDIEDQDVYNLNAFKNKVKTTEEREIIHQDESDGEYDMREQLYQDNKKYIKMIRRANSKYNKRICNRSCSPTRTALKENSKTLVRELMNTSGIEGVNLGMPKRYTVKENEHILDRNERNFKNKTKDMAVETCDNEINKNTLNDNCGTKKKHKSINTMPTNKSKGICVLPNIDFEFKKNRQCDPDENRPKDKQKEKNALLNLKEEVRKLLDIPLMNPDYRKHHLARPNMDLKPCQMSSDEMVQTNTVTAQSAHKDTNCCLGIAKITSPQKHVQDQYETARNEPKVLELTPDDKLSSMNASRCNSDAYKVGLVVVRRVSNHTVLVKWNSPENISEVVGYELLVDGRGVKKILSPSCCMAVVSCLPYSDIVFLTVRTITKSESSTHFPASTIVYRPKCDN